MQNVSVCVKIRVFYGAYPILVCWWAFLTAFVSGCLFRWVMIVMAPVPLTHSRGLAHERKWMVPVNTEGLISSGSVCSWCWWPDTLLGWTEAREMITLFIAVASSCVQFGRGSRLSFHSVWFPLRVLAVAGVQVSLLLQCKDGKRHVLQKPFSLFSLLLIIAK